MKNLFKQLVTTGLMIAILGGITQASLAGAAVTFKIVQTPAVSVYTSQAAADTTLTITPVPVDLDGNVLTISNFGSSPTITVDPGVTGYEEIEKFTTVTNNGNGTATLGGVSRDLQSVYPYTSAGTGKQHGAGAIVVFSNNPQVYGRLAALENDATITGTWTFSVTPTITNVPVNGTDAANKTYVDTFASSGCANGNETTRGCIEFATQIEMASSTQVGGTGANLSIWTKYATSSPYTTGLWAVITQNDGKINPTFLNGTSDNYTFNGTTTMATSTVASSSVTTLNVTSLNVIGTSTGLYPQVFGDGSDGASTTAASYTLTKDWYFTNYTITGGNTINTGGFRIFVSGTLINNGTLSNAGSGSTAGAAGTLAGGGSGGGAVGASWLSGAGGGGGGVVWIAAKNILVEGTITVAGGIGGNASNPGGGAASSNGSAGTSITKTLIQSGTGAAGGASSGNSAGAGGTISASNMSTRNLTIMNAFYDFLTSLPLAGGAGGGSGGTTSGSSNAGGGGGGQGGVIFELYHILTTSGTRTVTGGAAGSGLGSGGLSGSVGSSGIAIQVAI